MNELSRFRGALIGLALGDAMGSPLEGLKSGHIRQLFGEVQGFVDAGKLWEKKPARFRLAGLYTDETQQTLALADTLVKCRGFNPAFFAGLLKDLTEADTGRPWGAHRGLDPDAKAGLRELEGGEKSGTYPASGLLPAARAAAPGLYFHDDPEQAMKTAIRQAALTHKEPRAMVMAALVAFSVSRAVGGAWDRSSSRARMEEIVNATHEAETFLQREFLHLVPPAARERSGMTREGVKLLPRLLDLPEPGLAFRQITAEANRQFPPHNIKEPSSGFVMAGGLTALFLALSARDFAEALLQTLRMGGDADTIAAVASAITGARFGEQAIPREWKEKLLNLDQVALRAEALFHRSFSGLPVKELVAMETELSRKEEEQRAKFLDRLQLAADKKERKKPKEKKEKEKPSRVKDRVEAVAPSPPPGKKKKKKQKPRREKAPWKR